MEKHACMMVYEVEGRNFAWSIENFMDAWLWRMMDGARKVFVSC